MDGLFIFIEILAILVSIGAIVLSIISIVNSKKGAMLPTGNPKVTKTLSLVAYGLEMVLFPVAGYFFITFWIAIASISGYGYYMSQATGTFVFSLITFIFTLAAIVFIPISIVKSTKSCTQREMLFAQGGASFAQPQYAQPQYAQPQYAQPVAPVAPAAPEFKTCPACGTQVTAQARFCKGCGKDLG